MGKKVVIVESPAKANTIEKYLGKDFTVLSSIGHVRDLAKTGPGGLGVDIEHQFKPRYTIIPGKQKVIAELQKAIKDADTIYLATDPDREGEAISWHLYDCLELEKHPEKRVYRVVFHEITKNAILKAIENPGEINHDLVRSQESRRILDRIIGFKLSKLLQAKIKSKSAGRVQSVALKLIVDREREIEAFQVEEYYTIDGVFAKERQEFEANLVSYQEQKLEIKAAEEADAILAALGRTWKVQSVEQKERAKTSKLPFITSTLQQEASSKLNFNAKKTMMIAQKLYEGVPIDAQPVGLITYMRTDSTRLSEEFTKAALAHIKAEYGKEYVGSIKKEKRKGNVQDAHEAIRPTDLSLTPEKIKKYLTPDSYKLYRLIYYRTLASLMSAALLQQTTITIENNGYQFRANGQRMLFDGYLKVYADYEETKNSLLPLCNEGDMVECIKVEKIQHFTQPPARYTEAKLIKEMEELGIGRPSTYAQTMETLKERAYVKLEDKKFVPTEQGIITNDKLQEFFSSIINISYTAQMEATLDDIAAGKKVWYEELANFYNRFTPLLEKAQQKMEKLQPKVLDETCPLCGKALVVRKGRYGEFVGCSGYPECTYIKKENETEEHLETLDITCPKCHVGKFVERVTKKGPFKGRKFYACNNYPKCKNIVVNRPVDQICPSCGNILTMNADGKVSCENKACESNKTPKKLA